MSLYDILGKHNGSMNENEAMGMISIKPMQYPWISSGYTVENQQQCKIDGCVSGIHQPHGFFCAKQFHGEIILE